jgi:hypothetical protein
MYGFESPVARRNQQRAMNNLNFENQNNNDNPFGGGLNCIPDDASMRNKNASVPPSQSVSTNTGGGAGGQQNLAQLINGLQTTLTPLLTKTAESLAVLNASVQGLVQINTSIAGAYEQIKVVGENISSAATTVSSSYDKLAEAMKTPLKVEATHSHNIEGMIYLANTGGIAEEIGNALGEIIKLEVGGTLPDLIAEHLNNKPG